MDFRGLCGGITRTLAIYLGILLGLSPLWGGEKDLMIWDRDNHQVKKKLIGPHTRPKGEPGGTLVVHLSNEPDHLEPFTSTGVYSQRIYSYIFSSLVTRDGWTLEWKTGQDTDSVALSYRIEDMIVLKKGREEKYGGQGRWIGIWTRKGEKFWITDEKGKKQLIDKKDVLKAQKKVVYTFYLRKDFKFHDGVPLTADDVIFSMDVVKNKAVKAASLRNYFNDVQEWFAIDRYTVRFIYARPYWYAFNIISGLPIVPEHIFQPERYVNNYDQLSAQEQKKAKRKVVRYNKRFAKSYNEHPFRRHPIGSGPYKFKEWIGGDKIVLERFKEYTGRPAYLDVIVWKYISNDAAALQALKNGELDFLPGVPTEMFVKEAVGPEFKTKFVKATYYSPGYNYVGWNMKRFVFQDHRVRTALTYLMPRQLINKTLFYNMNKIITGPFYCFGPAYDHSLKPRPFDLKKAEALLREAGWVDVDNDGVLEKEGKEFRFEFLVIAESPALSKMAEMYQQRLKQAKILTKIRKVKWQALLEKIDNLNFDSVFLGWGTSVEGDPYQLWHSSQAKKGGSNFVSYKNHRVDRLIEKSRKIFNAPKRRAIMKKIHRIIYYDQPYTFLYTGPRKVIYHSKIRGVRWLKGRPGWDLQEWYIPKKFQ
ncbi:MAG: hypothetical protein D6805_03480 [Planctomycetota bacterium]|nr:MAG: hypothetical protein D6805_03480 [Planctomycetota bacterium]